MKKILLLVMIAALGFGCSKGKEGAACMNTVVFWGGDPAVDGLGWYLSDSRTSSERYYPESLPDRYQTDGLAVNVCLIKTLKKKSCFCAVQPPLYEVVSIKKR
jgi:hypothetical protein